MKKTDRPKEEKFEKGSFKRESDKKDPLFCK